MAVDEVFDGADFRVKVTSLRHEIPLEERECFAFFATELAKLRKHVESDKANDLILAHGFFPLVRATHERLLRTAYKKSGKVTQQKMRELVAYLKSTGFTGFEI